MPQSHGDVMFKFLFRGRSEPEVKIETQRETFTRLVEELNQAIDKFADKPAVTVDPATGHVGFEMPEQFPDEALALPSPDEAEASETSEPEAEAAEEEPASEDETKAA